MVNGEVAIFLFVTGAPSTMKCAVAPESDMAYCTDLRSLLGSNMVAVLGSDFNCNWFTMWLQACCFGGTIDWFGKMDVASVEKAHAHSEDSSSENLSSVLLVVVAVASSMVVDSFLVGRLEVSTVLSSSS